MLRLNEAALAVLELLADGAERPLSYLVAAAGGDAFGALRLVNELIAEALIVEAATGAYGITEDGRNALRAGDSGASHTARKVKQTIYLPDELLAEIQSEAIRLDRSLSWMVQQAWRFARGEVMRFPSVNDVLSGAAREDEREEDPLRQDSGPGSLTHAGVSPGPEEPEPVHLAAAVPSAVSPGSRFVARFAAYRASLEREVRSQLETLSPRAAIQMGLRSCTWRPGTRVRVVVSGEHLSCDPVADELTWDGQRGLLDFEVAVAPPAPAGTTVLRLDVEIGGFTVARIRLEVEIGAAIAARRVATATVATTAFASYASTDRARVLDRVAAARISAGLDVFLDCLSIHPGEQWKERLKREIGARELFLLFWSAEARRSDWVSWEWRTALALKDAAQLQLHPLDPVEHAPPPPELGRFHFGDALMAVRASLRSP